MNEIIKFSEFTKFWISLSGRGKLSLNYSECSGPLDFIHRLEGDLGRGLFTKIFGGHRFLQLGEQKSDGEKLYFMTSEFHGPPVYLIRDQDSASVFSCEDNSLVCLLDEFVCALGYHQLLHFAEEIGCGVFEGSDYPEIAAESGLEVELLLSRCNLIYPDSPISVFLCGKEVISINYHYSEVGFISSAFTYPSF